jgi:hypothetical protein
VREIGIMLYNRTSWIVAALAGVLCALGCNGSPPSTPEKKPNQEEKKPADQNNKDKKNKPPDGEVG